MSGLPSGDEALSLAAAQLVDSNPVNDSGLEQIARFRDLTHLRISSEAVTAEGVEALEGMTKLQLLEVLSPHVTVQSVEQLRSRQDRPADSSDNL